MKKATKVWLHSPVKDSICVVENSKEYEAALKDGGFYKSRAEANDKKLKFEDIGESVETVVVVEPVDVEKLSDLDLGELYDKCDSELVKRGLLEEEVTETPALDELSDDELRSLGKSAKIAGYQNMKRETLLKKLKGDSDDK